MKNSLASLALISIVLGSLTISSQLDAEIVTFSVDVPTLPVPGQSDLLLPFFDSSMGTLTEVAFDLTADGVVDYEVTMDEGGDGGDVSASVFGEFTPLVGVGSIGSAFELFGFGFYPGEGFFSVDVNGGTGDFSSDPAVVGLFASTTPGATFFTEVIFDGVDAFSESGDDVFAIEGFVFGGSLTVIYTFTPVPEPGATFLIGIGSLFVFQRRSRNTR